MNKEQESVNMQPYTEAELDEIRAMDKTSLYIRDRLLATIESDRSRFRAYLKLEKAREEWRRAGEEEKKERKEKRKKKEKSPSTIVIRMLKELASKASPGPWTVFDGDRPGIESNGSFSVVVYGNKNDDTGCERQEDAAFIAAFDPPTVLAMLDVIAEAENLRVALEAFTSLKVPEVSE